jgi:hypothetical protein
MVYLQNIDAVYYAVGVRHGIDRRIVRKIKENYPNQSAKKQKPKQVYDLRACQNTKGVAGQKRRLRWLCVVYKGS